jgi:hypothetical protein
MYQGEPPIGPRCYECVGVTVILLLGINSPLLNGKTWNAMELSCVVGDDDAVLCPHCGQVLGRALADYCCIQILLRILRIQIKICKT